MNYGQNPQAATDQPAPPVLKQFSDDLTNQLERMQSITSRIESKLHDIVNNRKPDVKENTPTPQIGDFAAFVRTKLDDIYSINARLEQIESHLGHII